MPGNLRKAALVPSMLLAIFCGMLRLLYNARYSASTAPAVRFLSHCEDFPPEPALDAKPARGARWQRFNADKSKSRSYIELEILV
jgi:hypothetical protein